MINKVVSSAAEAVRDVPDGASLAVGGFGLCGIPSSLIKALLDQGATDLEIVSNNCGVDDWGLGLLLAAHRIKRMVASYVGENSEFARQYLSGEVELEFNPQGTLAERLRAGAMGIPAFYTPAGVGTVVADGGLPLRFDADGNVSVTSQPKETRVFDGKKYVMEHAITCDYAFVQAWKADPFGNLVYHKTARNFNPHCAGAGRITIAEVDQIVPVGALDPNEIHTPGILVTHVVQAEITEKRIERRTVRA